MNCINHFEKKATNTCNICGQWFCENCTLEINGRMYCKNCLKNKLSENGQKEDFNIKSFTSNHSDLLTLLFSFIPGFGQMYLGFTRRGVLFLILFLSLAFSVMPFAFVVWAVSFFDTFKLKNHLQRGIYIKDDISDFKNFFKENKILLYVSCLLILLPIILDKLEDIFEDLFEMIKNISRMFFRPGRMRHYDDLLMNGIFIFVCTFISVFITIILIKVIQKIKNTDKNNKDDKDKYSQ